MTADDTGYHRPDTTDGNADIYIGCYWGDRSESAEGCAGRLLRLTGELGRLDPAFALWQLVVTAKGGEPVPSDPAQLARFIDARDPDRGKLPHVLSLVSWQKSRHEGASLSISCGGAAGISGVVNSVVLRPVYEGYGLDPWLQNARSILELAVQAFDPDWGVVLTTEFRAAQAVQPRVPLVGAVTYLDGWRGTPPTDVSASSFHRGWILDLHGGAATLPDIAEILQLRRTLSRTEMLQPTPQVQPGSSASQI